MRGGGAGPIDVRLERDVIALRPTVVTIMLGMNDGGYKPFDPMTLATFGEGYRAIVAKLQQALPGVRLTFIRSSPFDDVARPPQFAPGYDDTLRRLGCYVTTLGAKEKATVVDFRDPVNAGIAAVLKDNPDLARQVVPDRVHPGAAGHVVMGATLLRAWSAPALVTRVEIDAAGRRVVAAENTDVSGLAAEGGVSWTQLDRALPLPLSFEDGETELAQKAGADLESLDREPLVVTGLASGRFELKIDGQSVGTFAGRRAREGREPGSLPHADAVAGLLGEVVGGRRARSSSASGASCWSPPRRTRRCRRQPTRSRPGTRPCRRSDPWTRRRSPAGTSSCRSAD